MDVLIRRSLVIFQCSLTLLSEPVRGSMCLNGPCQPGNEFCGAPFENAPMFHLMDQHGCGENDPNGPVFDPVHGVIHHFYQIHLAADGGHGPNYGHFVSKDFINWAQLPVAIWNGFDSSVWPPKKTPYDSQAIFTGSAVIVDGAGPGGKGPGVVNIYPGLCNKNKQDWPSCQTGTLLAQAIPADYAGDALLTNWTKPDYNPIMENTERDPSTPWKLPNGEWRLRTYNGMYGAASDADFLAGKWYELNNSSPFRTCECPSLYPLPPPTPGFEKEYEVAAQQGSLPTHVHKTSCSGDWWQLGTYDAGAPKTTGNFTATPGWEDLYEQQRIDQGAYYASKDNEYPSKDGKPRRINWGWAQIAPQSAQSLPRIITFNPVARCLEQAPLDELMGLRGDAVYAGRDLKLGDISHIDLNLASGVARQSEVVLDFALPQEAVTFGISIASGADTLDCYIAYEPPSDGAVTFYKVPVTCGKYKDTLRLVPKDTSVQLRIYVDNTFSEAYFQSGRVAMTVPQATLGADTRMALFASGPTLVRSATVFPMRSIWVSSDEVRQAPRIYPAFVSNGVEKIYAYV